MSNPKILIIITGCNRGLGKEIVSAFKAYDTCCINRLKYTVDDCVVDLSKNSIDFDLIREKALRYSLVVFINNASIITPISAIRQIDRDDITKSMLVNYINPAKLITTVLQMDKKTVIVNITSGAAFSSNAELALYSSSKAAMHRYIDILAQEEKENKDVLLIANFDPGRMQTDMQEELISKIGKNIKKNDLNEPVKVAEKVFDLVQGALNSDE